MSTGAACRWRRSCRGRGGRSSSRLRRPRAVTQTALPILGHRHSAGPTRILNGCTCLANSRNSPRIWAACAIKCLCARLAGHFRRTPKTKILTSASCRKLWKALLCYIKHDSFLGTATRSGLRAPWARCMPPGEAGIGCAAAWWCSRVLPPPLPAHLASGHSLHSCGAACETGDVFLKNSSGQGVSRALIKERSK